MRKILLFCAMPSEFEEIQKHIPFPDLPQNAPFPLTVKLPGQSVWLTVTGIGKANAAAAASASIVKLQPDCVIGVGVAGGIAPHVKIGDVVVSSSALQYDMDATAFGYDPGIVPQLAVSDFPADVRLAELALELSTRLDLPARVHSDRLLSGDCFVSHDRGSEIYRQFGGAAVDMESSAWAQTAWLHKVPWVILRSISDQADGQAHVDYNQYLPLAMANLSQLAQKLIKEVL